MHVYYRQYSRNHKVWKQKYAHTIYLLHRLKDKPCMDYKTKYPPFIMHFDHRNPKKKLAGVTWLWRNKKKSIALAEIKKCDLVCANCHAFRTYYRRRIKKYAISKII